MCNYAVNSITFSSRNFSMLHDLHAKILSCYQSDGFSLVRELLESFGYSKVVLDRLTNRTDYFSDCDTNIVKRGPVFYFCCETTTSWSENMEPLIILMADKFRNKITLSFSTEEPGTDVFQVMDETGCFYPDRFKIDFCYNGNYVTEYFKTYSETIGFLQEAFPKANICCFDGLEVVREAINDAYADDAEEYFFNIYRFTDYVSNIIQFGSEVA